MFDSNTIKTSIVTTLATLGICCAFVWTFMPDTQFAAFVKAFELLYYISFVITAYYVVKTYGIQRVTIDRLSASLDLQKNDHQLHAITQVFKHYKHLKLEKRERSFTISVLLTNEANLKKSLLMNIGKIMDWMQLN